MHKLAFAVNTAGLSGLAVSLGPVNSAGGTSIDWS